MKDEEVIIKVINVTVDGNNKYALIVDQNTTLKELKKILESKSNLIKGTFRIIKDNRDLTNENQNISLKELFQDLNEINLYIETNINKKEELILIKINTNNK